MSASYSALPNEAQTCGCNRSCHCRDTLSPFWTSLKESLWAIFPPSLAAMVWETVSIGVPYTNMDPTGKYVLFNGLLGISGSVTEFLTRYAIYTQKDNIPSNQAAKRALIEAMQVLPSYTLWQPVYDFLCVAQDFNRIEHNSFNNRFNAQDIQPKWRIKPWLGLVCFQTLALSSRLLGASWRDTTCVGALSTGFQIAADQALVDPNLTLPTPDPSVNYSTWTTMANIAVCGFYTGCAGLLWDMMWKTGENLHELYQLNRQLTQQAAEAKAAAAITNHTVNVPDSSNPPAAAPAAVTDAPVEAPANPRTPERARLFSASLYKDEKKTDEPVPAIATPTPSPSRPNCFWRLLGY